MNVSADMPLNGLKNDKLGFKVYAEALAEVITTCETPMTIALQGDWGSGKSTLMAFIVECLQNLDRESQKPVDRYHCFTFNTWQYSQLKLQDSLELSLLFRFAREVKAGDRVKTLLSDIFKSTAIIGAGLLGNSWAKETVENAVNAFADADDYGAKLVMLKEEIKKAVKNFIEEAPQKRVVVFIDDLDRLAPTRAVELLEVLKMFLDVQGCVFVLACDKQVIEEGLKEKFKISSSGFQGKSFFDKIIQLPFHMPVEKYDNEEFITDILNRLGGDLKQGEWKQYGLILENSIGFNPRSVKRIANTLALSLKIGELQGNIKDAVSVSERSIAMRVIFLALCMQEKYTKVYERIMFQKEFLRENNVKKLIEALAADVEVSHARKAEPDKYRKYEPFIDQMIKVSESFESEFVGTFADYFRLSGEVEEVDGDQRFEKEYYANVQLINEVIEDVNQWISENKNIQGLPNIVFKRYKPRSVPDAMLYHYDSLNDFQIAFCFGSDWGIYYSFGTSAKSNVDERRTWVKRYFSASKLTHSDDDQWCFAYKEMAKFEEAEREKLEGEFKAFVKKNLAEIMPQYKQLLNDIASGKVSNK